MGLGNLCDSTELLVAELVTNAVKASREVRLPAAVRLWLAADSAHVLILVWDATLQARVRKDTSDSAEGSRGLMLLEPISEQWGGIRAWTVTGNMCGRVVQADGGRDNQHPESC